MSSPDSRVYIIKDGDFSQPIADFKYMSDGWAEDGVPMEVEIRPYVPKRSNLANRFYWEILSQAGEQTGHTKDELHLFFRHKFLGAEHKLIFDQNFNMLPSTTDLNVKEFANYVRSVETFILESGFEIKAPPYYNDIWR
jgi:hypothetical protein